MTRYVETTLPNGNKRRVISNTVFSIEGQAVDYTPQRIQSATFDGWEVSNNDWQFRLGEPLTGDLLNLDGVLGFGRNGSWIGLQLNRFGWLNWSDLTYTNLQTATYNRANLSQQVDTVEGINTQAIATWSGILGGTDLKIYAEGKGLKSEIRINQTARNFAAANKPAGDSLYLIGLFRVDLINVPRVYKQGILQSLTDIDDDNAHGLELKDALDNLIAFMPVDQGWIELADGSTSATYKLRKRIFTNAQGIWLAVGIPEALFDAAPAGTLVIDPTFDSQPNEASGIDTWMRQSTPTTNYSTENKLAIFEGNDRMAVIRFDLSSIPSSATVTSATLTLTSKFASSNRSNTVYPLLVSFVESECTWNQRSSGNNWNSGGGSTADTDYDSTADDTGTLSSSSGTPTNFDVSTSAQAFISGTNYGWMIRDPSDSGYGEWDSSNASTASDRPQLVIEYTTVSTYNESASDGLSMSETTARNLTIGLSASDGLAAGETTIKVSELNLSTADGSELSETLTRLLDMTEAATDAADIGDAATRTLDLTTVTSDTTDLTDTPTAALDATATTSDTTDLSETITRTLDISRSAADGVTLSDSATRVLSINRTATDGVTLSEALAYTGVWVAVASDAAVLSETANRTLTLAASASDSVVISENTARVLEITKALADAITMSEANSNTLDAAVSVTDVLSLAEQTSGVLELSLTASDIATLSDSSAGGTLFIELVTDGIELSDTAARSLDAATTASDTVNLSESATAQMDMANTVSDGVTVSESASGALTISVSISDIAELADTSIGGLLFAAVVTDALTMSEAVSNTMTLSVTVTDAAQIGETISRVLDLVATASDGAVFADVSTSALDASARGVVTLTFTLKRASVAFSLLQPIGAFGLLQPAGTFSLLQPVVTFSLLQPSASFELN